MDTTHSTVGKSEEGIKVGDGKSSFLAGLDIKRTRILQEGINPQISSFKEYSRNACV